MAAGLCRAVRHLEVCCLLAAVAAGFAGAPRESNAGEADKIQVIVSLDGSVYAGRVRTVPGGYRVDREGTFIVLPFEQVRLTAPSLPEAYEKLRDSVRLPTVEDHLLLAEWCLRNQLAEQAQNEVLAAMKLEPLRTDSKDILARIDKQLGRPAPPSLASPSMPARTFLQTEELTSAGLTRKTHEQYMRTIQPLLFNKCGNARCHGKASDNEFILQNVPAGTSAFRASSQQNLETILEYIDLEFPHRSQILKKPVEPTPEHQKLFLGAVQHRQYVLLEAWVRQAAEDRRTSRSSKASPIQKVTRAGLEGDAGGHSITPVSGESISTSAASPRTGQSGGSLLDRARQESRPDAFDPDRFNRMVHGITAREHRERASSPGSSAADQSSAAPFSSR